MGINLTIFLIGELLSPGYGSPDLTFEIIPYYLVTICWILFFPVIILMVVPKLKESKEEINPIRKKILDLGTQFTRLEIKEISVKLGVDTELIKRVILSMVSNQDIYGDYFNSTKTVVFNQQANIDQIDILMSKYKEWEEFDSKDDVK